MRSIILHVTLVNEIGMQLEVFAASPLLNTGVTIACAHSLYRHATDRHKNRVHHSKMTMMTQAA